MRWYFSFRFVDEFGNQVVDELVRVLPQREPASDKTKVVVKHRQRNDRAVELVRRKVSEFRGAQKLNLFQSARLSQRLQNGLIERGYAVDVARAVALEAIS